MQIKKLLLLSRKTTSSFVKMYENELYRFFLAVLNKANSSQQEARKKIQQRKRRTRASKIWFEGII